jgi:nucleoside-triphosphatase
MSRGVMPNNILVRGRPGSGKTTLVVNVVQSLSAEGFKAAGFVTEEIRGGSHRLGFKVRDLRGDTATMAHIEYAGKPRVGKYGVDLEAFERVALKALDTFKGEVDFTVIDEIGRMEMASSTFRSVLMEILDIPMPLLATVHKAGDPFTGALLDREDVSVYDIGPGSRDSLLEVIHDSLLGILAETG